MAAKSQIDKYFRALEVLKARGDPINNDAVAREAGSGKGSIKRSRPGYAKLIEEIEAAEAERKVALAATDPSPALNQQLALLKERLDSALEREICLLNEVYTLREENRQLKQGRLTVVSDKNH